MNEILFRGKRVDDGKWTYGWYAEYPFGRYPVKSAIIPSEDARAGHFGFQEVFRETVGWYTGLNDKNGKKIFSGDIVTHCWGEDRLVNFLIGFVSGEFLAVPVERRADTWPIRISGEDKELEVIGNFHDNPELMGGGNNE